MDGREPMAAVLTEQEIYERAGGGSAAISGSGAIGFFSLDPGKIGGINDSRVVVREKMLLVFWHALILSVNRGAGAFFQAENSRVKIIVEDFLYHAIGPAVGNGAAGEFSKLDFPFVERLGRRGHAMVCEKKGNPPIAQAGEVKAVDFTDDLCLFGDNFQNFFVIGTALIAERRPREERSFFLTGVDGTFDLFACVFYISFIKPGLDPDHVVAGIHGIVIVIDDDQVFAALLKFIEQQKNLCVMPAKARKIFDIHGIDAVVEISHQLLKARPVKNIAGKAVILIPPVDDCAMCLGVLAYNQLLIFDGNIISLIIVSGETDIACIHGESFPEGNY